jgi:hypothetical protein
MSRHSVLMVLPPAGRLYSKRVGWVVTVVKLRVVVAGANRELFCRRRYMQLLGLVPQTVMSRIPSSLASTW